MSQDLRRDCRRIRELFGLGGFNGWMIYAQACGLSGEDANDIWHDVAAEEMKYENL